MEEKAGKTIKIVKNYSHGGAGAVYGLGFVGALIYFLQHSATFPEGLLGLLKAIVWPALLVYKILTVWRF